MAECCNKRQKLEDGIVDDTDEDRKDYNVQVKSRGLLFGIIKCWLDWGKQIR
jgi:hypothetical protein